MGGACSRYGGEKRCKQGFGGEPEANRALGRLRRRWEDNIKMDLQEVEWGSRTGMNWLRIRTGGWLL